MESEQLAEVTAGLLGHLLETGLEMHFCSATQDFTLLSVYTDDDGILTFDIELCKRTRRRHNGI